ncbi:RNA polymerase II subunit A C-terminal domain phosphatase [Grifola frondosa]|uniref:RNA polymerase II subunit A C-terminal domain phosphatase n=1 Tax=Grifola frondosa TaxID=5627 RepID=A0A1C7MRG8_GRIFR|nr:RNA polymerase II subunit A C-terminal domain phosphatase [Grifola frondosa]
MPCRRMQKFPGGHGYSVTHLLTSILTPDPELRFGTWDSAVEGTLSKWNFKPGDIVSQRRAKESPAVYIMEPCKHGVQLGGLCCLCGKDMTNFDYMGFSDTSRASIQMTHLANGPLVSLEEAQRIEQETAEHLYTSRKLSLIVDLDQTIVHATVDPTVQKPETESDNATEDEVNPNWDALKDVKKFRLGPEALGQPHQRGGKGKEKIIEQEGCMYYIKPRPGLHDFLLTLATKYEMHVYTMGTRAYAEEVCAAIDPQSNIFGGRILSRDESGSMTQKSLQRLFPSDQSMVVIIDDRADVWDGVQISALGSSSITPEETVEEPPPTQEEAEPAQASEVSDERAELEQDDILTRNTMALEAQFEERPLAKKQEELEETEEAEEAKEAEGVKSDEAPKDANAMAESTERPKTEHHHRKPLLKNDDIELARVKKILELVHQRFYAAYDERKPTPKLKRKPGKRHPPPHVDYDVRTDYNSSTTDGNPGGLHILFSSVIPLDTRPEATEVWRTAHAFGAKCYTELSSNITHVVAAKRGTLKVDAARRQGGVKIVWLAWFTDSVALWQHQDETPYLMDPEPLARAPLASPPSDPYQISSDPEPDADDWDEVDWNAINDEVEAAMNESDDESGNVSEDDGSWTDESNSVISSTTSSPRLASISSREAKKLAAERSGASKLKEAITADDLESTAPEDAAARPPTPAAVPNGDDDLEGDESDDEDDMMDEEDDFLARELEEELG